MSTATQATPANLASAAGEAQPHNASAPRIGQPWPEQGGIYAGLIAADDGDYHLILSPELPGKRLAWAPACEWAKGVATDGHADFRLPDRRESALLFANVPTQFEAAWYWTGEQLSADYAWFQGFAGGYQVAYDKDYKGRARAVRRFLVA